MELKLISCGVSSPFRMRYVNRGTAAVQEDINDPKIKAREIFEYYVV